MKKKKRILLFLLPSLAILFSSCSGTEDERQIQVGIEESDKVCIQDNGVWIEPGEDAVFLLEIASGYDITGLSYDGEYRLSDTEEGVRLELLDVQYPTRVKLDIAADGYCTICYDVNGGSQKESTDSSFQEKYDISLHTRPNTETGIQKFVRPGYTLVSWNTKADGSGERIGLGSRVTVSKEKLTLYAQWEKWTGASDFSYEIKEDEVVLTGYTGKGEKIVIPEQIDGLVVTTIAAGAFLNVSAKEIILPYTMKKIEDRSFMYCGLTKMTLSDNIEYISDASFQGCSDLQTLYINAVEDPFGYAYRKESVYADKVDLVIRAAGKKKLVFYGGCSMWYNLDGEMAVERLGDEYTVINMGLNGTCSSVVQMEILENFMEAGDILFHTPELSSTEQLMLDIRMDSGDDKIWCGAEYNYDLISLGDIRRLSGIFDSWQSYLKEKGAGGSYTQEYMDSKGRTYMDATGSLPFERTEQAEQLQDEVHLDPSYLKSGLPLLLKMYDRYAEKGIQVYVSYACVDLDDVSEEEQKNVSIMDTMFHKIFEESDSAELISSLEDYLYKHEDFYDTVYHMLSPAAERNTESWLRDLASQQK